MVGGAPALTRLQRTATGMLASDFGPSDRLRGAGSPAARQSAPGWHSGWHWPNGRDRGDRAD